MKKLFAIVIVATLLAVSIVTLVGCNQADINVEIIQFGNFDALNSAAEGFTERLEDWANEQGKTIHFEERNANATASNVAPSVQSAIANQPDLIYAIATPCAVNAAGNTTDIPVLYTAVTNPTGEGLVGQDNVYGTSDMNPVALQIELIKDLVPNVKKIAFLFCSSETNSIVQVGMAKAQCALMKIDTKDFAVSSASEIAQVVASIGEDFDAIYIPTDNMLSNSISTVASANTHNIPLIVGEAGMIAGGGWATLSINYKVLGEQTAEIAIKLLSGQQVSDAERHQMYAGALELVISEDAKTALGLTSEQVTALQQKYGE